MPSALHVPDSDAGWSRADAPELDRKLREGDGLGFPGDPALYLGQGVVTSRKRQQHPKTGAWLYPGDIIARRWEVWRHCEDGVDRIIGHWPEHDFDRIIFDLAPMRLDAPNRVSSEDAIDAHNAEIEDKNSREAKDVIGEATEHLAKLVHDRTQPRNVFRGIPGLRDEPKADA